MLVVLMLFLLVSATASALSITPAKIEVAYSQGSTETVTFRIGGTEDKPEISFRGEYAPYVYDYKLRKEGGFWVIEVTFVQGGTFSPGGHELSVVVGQPIKSVYGRRPQMGGRVEIGGRVTIYVPSDYKYLNFRDFEYEQRANRNVKAYYVLKSQNLGKEAISTVSSKATITPLADPNSQLSINIPFTAATNIEYLQMVEQYAEWQVPADMPYGEYQITPLLNYDGTEVKLNTFTFTVGDLELEIMDLSSTQFETGKISTTELSVQSFWSSAVQYTPKMQVIDRSGKTVKQFAGAPNTIRLISTGSTTLYFDGTGLAVGDYNLNVTVDYEGKTTSKMFPIKVIPAVIPAVITAPPPVAESSTSITTIAIIVGIVILIIIIIFVIKKKREQSEEV